MNSGACAADADLLLERAGSGLCVGLEIVLNAEPGEVWQGR